MIDLRFYTLLDGGMSVADLCARLDLENSASGALADSILHRPAALEYSQPGDVCFLTGKRSVSLLDNAKATACFVSKQLAQSVADRNIIPVITEFPKYAISKTTALMVSEKTDLNSSSSLPLISPDAIIHPSVIVGQGVKIGAGTIIGPNCVIEKAVVGENCRIGSCTVIGGSGFGVASGPNGEIIAVPHIGRVVIGDNVRIGSNVCIDRGQLGDTMIGSGSQIDNLVQIAHNCQLDENVVLASRVGLSGSCQIGRGVQMGGGVGIADHVSIGEGARLAAYAGVMHDVPPGETWSGIPAQPIRDHMKMVAMARKSIKK